MRLLPRMDCVCVCVRACVCVCVCVCVCECECVLSCMCETFIAMTSTCTYTQYRKSACQHNHIYSRAGVCVYGTHIYTRQSTPTHLCKVSIDINSYHSPSPMWWHWWTIPAARFSRREDTWFSVRPVNIFWIRRQ